MVAHTRTPTARNGGFCAVLAGSGGGFSGSLGVLFEVCETRILCGAPHKRRMPLTLTPSVGFFGQK